jgi:pre-rRNA-processing protein TSR1
MMLHALVHLSTAGYVRCCAVLFSKHTGCLLQCTLVTCALVLMQWLPYLLRILCLQARSTDGSDPCSVLPGSWVTLVLADVPAAAAAAVLERTAAAAAAACSAGDSSMSLDVTSVTGAVPLTVYGLLQHEAKLSVVNFSMKKAASYAETIRSKEELLLVCGVRSFMGQPVLSDDAQGADKNKMERFLHPGKTAVGSVYAPISFPPLPLLAFKVRCA